MYVRLQWRDVHESHSVYADTDMDPIIVSNEICEAAYTGGDDDGYQYEVSSQQ